MSVLLLSDVLRAMSLAADSAEVQAYAAATWGQALEIHEDIRPQDPPKLSAGPQVHLCADQRNRSEDQVDMAHTVILAVVADLGRPTALAGTRVTYFPGRARLEGLARLVERAASQALHGLAVPFVQVPVDPDKLWADGLGVFYCYQLNFHDPLYT